MILVSCLSMPTTDTTYLLFKLQNNQFVIVGKIKKKIEYEEVKDV